MLEKREDVGAFLSILSPAVTPPRGSGKERAGPCVKAFEEEETPEETLTPVSSFPSIPPPSHPIFIFF